MIFPIFTSLKLVVSFLTWYEYLQKFKFEKLLNVLLKFWCILVPNTWYFWIKLHFHKICKFGFVKLFSSNKVECPPYEWLKYSTNLNLGKLPNSTFRIYVVFLWNISNLKLRLHSRQIVGLDFVYFYLINISNENSSWGRNLIKIQTWETVKWAFEILMYFSAKHLVFLNSIALSQNLQVLIY